MKKKILILKNDRAGDLISSLRLIYKLTEGNEVNIYLSEINYNFQFLLNKSNVKKINFNLTFNDKISIINDIKKNNYDEIFILCPKNFYYFLPFIFRKIKFYAIVINGIKRNRPFFWLRKYLWKFSIRYRDRINHKNVIQSNLSLINADMSLNFNHLNLNDLDSRVRTIISDNYIFFQFKKRFFEELNWGKSEFEIIIAFLKKKYSKVVFSSDIEESNYDKYFENNYSSIDFNNEYSFNNKKDDQVIYLKKIDPRNLFLITKNANKTLCPHGLITQISHLLNKDSLNLFSFKINNKEDYHHQKISFSEWYANMGIKFTFLNNDINKALKKLSKFV